MELLERITVEADKCGGRPCIRGLRVTVGTPAENDAFLAALQEVRA